MIEFVKDLFDFGQRFSHPRDKTLIRILYTFERVTSERGAIQSTCFSTSRVDKNNKWREREIE